VFMDAGFGLFYYRSVGSNSNMIYGGVSVPQLFGADLTFNADTDAFQLQKIQHLYGLLGYYKFLGDGAYLEPTVWIKTTKGAEMNVQGSIRYQFPSALWIGTGAGTSGIYHFETGLNLGYGLGYPNIKIGYSYDYSFSKISTSSRSSHQFNITYSFEY
ncbi:MAG: type IX secretion system membrane protein PorP/SprF, partial [Bacteroidia bacterium]|nr:type IX secretion system membrane protein PorP/SprF [Bacteroidia bacterium]